MYSKVQKTLLVVIVTIACVTPWLQATVVDDSFLARLSGISKILHLSQKIHAFTSDRSPVSASDQAMRRLIVITGESEHYEEKFSIFRRRLPRFHILTTLFINPFLRTTPREVKRSFTADKLPLHFMVCQRPDFFFPDLHFKPLSARTLLINHSKDVKILTRTRRANRTTP